MVENNETTTRLVHFTKLIHVLFVSNLLFLLMSSYFFFTVLFVPLTNQTLFWYLISSLTVMPALTAMVYVIWKYLKTGEISVFQHFFHSYKENFKLSFMIGTLNIVLGSVFVFNYVYIKTHQTYNQLWLIPISLILACIIATSIYQVVILARFKMNFSRLIAVSWFYLLKYFSLTVRNLAIFFLVILLAPIIPAPLRLLLTVSFLVYGLLLNMKKTLISWENESQAS